MGQPKVCQIVDVAVFLTDSKMVAWLFQKSLAQLRHKRFARIIAELQPQLIITTHALVSSSLCAPTKTASDRCHWSFNSQI